MTLTRVSSTSENTKNVSSRNTTSMSGAISTRGSWLVRLTRSIVKMVEGTSGRVDGRIRPAFHLQRRRARSQAGGRSR